MLGKWSGAVLRLSINNGVVLQLPKCASVQSCRFYNDNKKNGGWYKNQNKPNGGQYNRGPRGPPSSGNKTGSHRSGFQSKPYNNKRATLSRSVTDSHEESWGDDEDFTDETQHGLRPGPPSEVRSNVRASGYKTVPQFQVKDNKKVGLSDSTPNQSSMDTRENSTNNVQAFNDSFRNSIKQNGERLARITQPTIPLNHQSNEDRSDENDNEFVGVQNKYVLRYTTTPKPERPPASKNSQNFVPSEKRAPRNEPSRNEPSRNEPSRNEPSRNEPSRHALDSNYNYGLSGVGKAPPKNLMDSPPVRGEILYGIHSAVLALTAGRRRLHKCYIRDTLANSDRPIMKNLMSLIQEKGLKFDLCNKNVLTALSHARPNQGICLDAEKLDYENFSSESTTEESPFWPSSGEPRLFVVLDSVQDPMNLGAIIRSSYFLGVDRLFVVKENSCSLTPVVSKSSAGVMEISKIYSVPNLIEFLSNHAQQGWDVIGTTGPSNSNPDKIISLPKVTLEQNTILVLGNEGSGLTEAVESICHRLVTIPGGRTLNPLVDSLNVSVATGILLHHLCQLKSNLKSTTPDTTQ